MKWERFLKPCAAAVFVCGFAQIATAANNGPLPAEPWSIAPLPAKSASGTSYCSMKTSFPHGQMVVFAQDAKGSNSIAFDLHKDILEVGRQYDVTLKAGAATRDTVALGATRQVVVVQMGADSGFYNALKRRHNLSIEAGNKIYNFNLDSSVAEGLSSLSQCASSLDSGHTFAAVSVPLGKKAPAEVAAAEEQPAQDAVKAQPVDPVEAVETKPVRKIASARNVSSESNELKMLRAENKILRNENRKVQRADSSPAPVPAVTSFDYDELQRLKAENTQLAEENQRIKGEMIATQQEVTPPAAQQSAAEESALAQKTEPVPSQPADTVEWDQPIMASAPQQQNEATLKDILQSSRVAPQDALQAEDEGANAYRWVSDNIYGSAQQMPLEPGQNLSDMASTYIQQAASICKGDFAHKAAPARKVGTLDVVEAEMTCMDGENDAAAAVLFMADQMNVGIITQEGTPDQLSSALLKREQLISAAEAEQLN